MAISVYLVDDHAVVIDGLSCLLHAETDFKVIGRANNGRTAVEEIGRLSPGVVTMDIEMPDLNGIEATRLIHREHPKIRIVMLSRHSSPEYVFRALQAGATGYLHKISAGSEVIGALREVHAGNRFFSKQIAEIVADGYAGEHLSIGPLRGLSPRERQVMQMLVEGASKATIADALILSPRTIETYRVRLMQKLGISNLPALVKYAIRHGVTSID
jgi:DNA-binding NarL/FixJ family response regulator